MIKKHYKRFFNNFEKKIRSINNNNNNNTDKKQTITLSWIPTIGPKIKKEKFGSRVAFLTGPNLKNILRKNKDILIPNSQVEVHELKCSCRSIYDGKTKQKKS